MTKCEHGLGVSSPAWCTCQEPFLACHPSWLGSFPVPGRTACPSQIAAAAAAPWHQTWADPSAPLACLPSR